MSEYPGNSMTRSTFVLAAAALGVLALSACDDRPSRSDDEGAPVQVQQEETAPVQEESPAPAPEVRDPAPTPPPSDTLPPEERSSEQSVQPESETLFY